MISIPFSLFDAENVYTDLCTPSTTNGLTATVNSVGGSTAANLHNAELRANAATSTNANSTIVMRDSSGNINAGQVFTSGTAVENTANKAKANGYAPLDGGGLLPAANLPTSAVTATTLNNGTLPGSFASVSASGPISTSAVGAGAFMMTAGASQTPPTNTVGLQAPVSVPNSFNCTWWGVSAAGPVHATSTIPCILSPSLIVLSDLDPSFPAVDLSGSYTDLTNQPTIPAASTGVPAVNGTAAAGVSTNYARADHVHPTDVSRQAAIGAATMFGCEFYANLNACLDAGKAFTTANESGGGHAARILIHEGTFTLTSYPYTITSGMEIIGVMPREIYSPGVAPVVTQAPNGGTWIDCGGTQCFAGVGLRGVVLEKLGFIDFNTSAAAVSFGGNGLDGIAQSRLQDLFFIGGPCVSNVCPSNIALDVFNFNEVTADTISAYQVNVGLHLVGQGAWCCPGNSTFKDVFVNTYPKSVANNNATTRGIWLQPLVPTAGTTMPLNIITFIRAQVNSYSGDSGPGTEGFSIQGASAAAAVNSITMYGVDVEGSLERGVYLQYTANDHIEIATSTTSSGSLLNTIYLDSNAQRNVFDSNLTSTTVFMTTPRGSGANDNVFYGLYSAEPANFPMLGEYRIYNQSGITGENTRTQYVNGMTVGPGPTAPSGNTAVGADSPMNTTTGSDNTCVGDACMLALTTGSFNAAFGYAPMENGLTENYGAAVGGFACRAASSGATACTAVGYQALDLVTSGANNTAIGYQAGITNQTTGHNNTYLGALTSNSTSTQQSFMTLVGDGATASCSNCVVLGRTTDTVTIPGALAGTGAVTGNIAAAPVVITSPAGASDVLCALGADGTVFLSGVLNTVTVTPGSDASLPASGTWTTTGGGGTDANGTFTAAEISPP